MFVLGLDPGLSVTGYAVVDDGPSGPVPIAVGVIRTDPEAETASRLAELYADLARVLAEYRPAEAAIEVVFANRNLRTASSVAQAAGVAMLTAAQASVPVFEYTPSAVKAAVAGYGQADKAQIQEVVARRLGLADRPEPPDAADALAIALCHVQSSPMRRAIEAGT